MVYVLNGTRYDSNECFIAVVLRLLAQIPTDFGGFDGRTFLMFILSEPG